LNVVKLDPIIAIMNIRIMKGLIYNGKKISVAVYFVGQALELMYIEEHGTKDTYVWRATTVMGGVYLFFLIERFLKVVFNWKEVSISFSTACIKNSAKHVVGLCMMFVYFDRRPNARHGLLWIHEFYVLV